MSSRWRRRHEEKRGRGRPPKANPKDPKAAGRKAKQREWDQREEAKLRQLRALDEGIAPHQLNIDLLADVWRDVTMDQVTRVLRLEERIDWPRFFIKHLKLHAKIDKTTRQSRADEAKAAGDQRFLRSKSFKIATHGTLIEESDLKHQSVALFA